MRLERRLVHLEARLLSPATERERAEPGSLGQIEERDRVIADRVLVVRTENVRVVGVPLCADVRTCHGVEPLVVDPLEDRAVRDDAVEDLPEDVRLAVRVPGQLPAEGRELQTIAFLRDDAPGLVGADLPAVERGGAECGLRLSDRRPGGLVFQVADDVLDVVGGGLQGERHVLVSFVAWHQGGTTPVDTVETLSDGPAKRRGPRPVQREPHLLRVLLFPARPD